MGARSAIRVRIRRVVEEVITVNAMAWDQEDVRDAVRDYDPNAVLVEVVLEQEEVE